MAEGDHSAGPNTEWPLDRVLETLKSLGSEENRAGMARFGIETERAFGIPMAQLQTSTSTVPIGLEQQARIKPSSTSSSLMPPE